MADLLDFLYDLLPPWLATTIAAGIGLAAGIGGGIWRGHEQHTLALCNSSYGEFTHAVDGAAYESCSGTKILGTIALIVEIGGYLMLGIFIIVLLALARTGKLHELAQSRASGQQRNVRGRAPQRPSSSAAERAAARRGLPPPSDRQSRINPSKTTPIQLPIKHQAACPACGAHIVSPETVQCDFCGLNLRPGLPPDWMSGVE